jgi:hypothetical protein
VHCTGEADQLLYSVSCIPVHCKKCIACLCTVKKVNDIPVRSRDITYQTLHGWAGPNYIIQTRESLVSDIPAGDGNVAYLLVQRCQLFL